MGPEQGDKTARIMQLEAEVSRLTEENEKLKKEVEKASNPCEMLQEICAFRLELDVTVEENEKQRARIAELEEHLKSAQASNKEITGKHQSIWKDLMKAQEDTEYWRNSSKRLERISGEQQEQIERILKDNSNLIADKAKLLVGSDTGSHEARIIALENLFTDKMSSLESKIFAAEQWACRHSNVSHLTDIEKFKPGGEGNG